MLCMTGYDPSHDGLGRVLLVWSSTLWERGSIDAGGGRTALSARREGHGSYSVTLGEAVDEDGGEAFAAHLLNRALDPVRDATELEAALGVIDHI